MLGLTPVEFNQLETLPYTFINPPRKNPFIRENIFNKAQVRRIAIAVRPISAIFGSYTESAFVYHLFDLRQFEIFGGGHPIVDFAAAGICRLHVTTMKAMNFQDGLPSFPSDNFKDHYVLVFDLNLMQDATKNCHSPKLVGEPMRLEPNFTFLLENVTELIVLEEWMSSVAFAKFGVAGKRFKNGYCFSPANNQPYPTTQVSVPWFFPLWLCFSSLQWQFCHYKHATQQFAELSLDNDCKILSNIVFCQCHWA